MTNPDMSSRAHIIAHALPYMQRYDDRTVVVKYGGNAMGDPELGQAFARDITLLRQSGVKPVVVHGGGPQIGKMLQRLNIVSEFKGGLRVTDKATVEVVEMVLAGSINKEIVQMINAEGGRAVGLCGKDGNLVTARKLKRTMVDPDSNIESVIDLGFVGEPAKVDPTVLKLVLKAAIIPVVAPVAHFVGVRPEHALQVLVRDVYPGVDHRDAHGVARRALGEECVGGGDVGAPDVSGWVEAQVPAREGLFEQHRCKTVCSGLGL